jgi:uncharacterized Zn-binding protein involved in type VI secretion
MPNAARRFDPTGHPGLVVQGSPDVLIENQSAARVGDKHVCVLPPPAGPHPASPITKGSASVLINGLPAARQFDTAGCGAPILQGAITVMIGD